MPIDLQSKKPARRNFAAIVAISLAIMLAQLVIVMTFNEQKTVSLRYATLAQWDSVWFSRILASGYYVNPAVQNIHYTNTVFPPGLPLLGFVIQKLTRLSPFISILLASQIATCVFWMYFLLLAKRFRVSPFFTAAGVLCVLLYPASFFFVVGYSDSLFLAMLLGLLYWQSDNRRYSWLLAGIHGCLMTATRIVGIPLIILPLVFAVFSKGIRGLRDPRPWIVTVLSGAGAGAFFLFCKLVFGEWFLQVRAHQYWATKPDINALINPIFYRFIRPMYVDGVLHPDYISIMSFQVLLSFIITCLIAEAFTLKNRGSSPTTALRMTLYAAAFIAWAFTLIARSRNVSGAFRYMIVPEILCILGLMGWSKAMGEKKIIPSIVFWAVVVALSATISMQIVYIARYTHSLWVA